MHTTIPTPTTDDSTPPSSTPPVTGELAWGACDDEIVTDQAYECGTLTVPLDPDDPAGDTLDLALIRLPAADPSTRVGAILTNPGGPGGSGFDFIARAGVALVSEMGLEHFDIVGFDPRGVDRVDGMRLRHRRRVHGRPIYLDDTPDTPEEQALLDEDERGFTTGARRTSATP